MATFSSRNMKNYRRGGNEQPAPVKPIAPKGDKHVSPTVKVKK